MARAVSVGRALPGSVAQEAMAPEYRRGDCVDPPEESLIAPRGADPARFVGPWREAAVLILFYEREGLIRFPLMLRPDGLGAHAGQVSLPGGSREPGESLEACALREAAEELGVDPGAVRTIRALSPLRVPPSRFVVQPYVGMAAGRPNFRPSPDEVAALLEPSLAELLDPANALVGESVYGGRCWKVPYYLLAGQRVWGATAMILSELRAMIAGQATAG